MDDSKWHIGGKVLFLNGKVYNKQIKNVIAGRMLQEIKVILETEEKVFKLENYSPPIGSGYKADVHGRSRSLFLKWLNFQREFQSSDVEEEEEKQQQNSGSLYIDDENDDSKSRNSSIDASWKELTASEEQVLDEEKNEQVHKGIKKKDDENDEESKLIGENVLVNIGNLRPAKPERMVRQVNRRHVEELVSSFLSAKVFTQYTPMVGVVFSEEKEIDFLQNGTCVVEVLGGNHTLQALLEIKAQLDIVTVTIRLYRNLTDQQCLRIGFKHNDVHEKSRKNTFSEQCLLARRLLSDTRRRFRNMGKKNQMTIWREEVATVFGVNKEAIKNTGRVLLHIASLSDQLWDAMTKVFHQWENGRILKQARGEIMKNTFSCITNIANEQEKLELLTQLATGKLEWKLFKKECAKRKAKGKCVKHAAAEPLRAQVEVRNDAYQFPSDEEEEVEVSLAISEASMSSVGTPPKEIQVQQKEDNNNDDLIKSLQEDLETKRKECLQLVKTLNEKDSLIQEMEFTIDSHSKTISTLKNRVSFAESAASRAREELKQMQTDKKQRGQKHNEKVATNLKNVAAKTAKPSEQSAPDDVDSNATTANKEKGKKRSDNQDSAYGRKKTKLGAVETLNNSGHHKPRDSQSSPDQINGALPVKKFSLSPETPAHEVEWSVIGSHQVKDRTFMAVVVVKGTLASISIHYRPAVDSTSSNGLDSPVHTSPPDRYSSLIPLEPMQEKRCAFGLKMLNNKLFACGGYDRGECIKSTEQYSFEDNLWTSLAEMKSPRSRFSVSEYKGKIYACGGSDGHREIKTVEVYDSEEDRWKYETDCPSALASPGNIIKDEKLYIIGGSMGQKTVAECEAYNLDNKTWTHVAKLNTRHPRSNGAMHLKTNWKTDVKGKARFQVAVCCYEDQIWAIGGTNGWKCLTETEMYDSQSDTWSPGPPLNIARRGPGIAVFNGTIYVVGGNDGTTALNSTEILDRKSGSWVLGPMLSVPRGNCGVCVLENKLFAVGGFNGKKFLDTLEYLDTEHSDEWCTYLPVEYYKKSSHIQDALSADHEKSKNKIGQLTNGNKEDDEKEDGSQQELSNRPDLLPVMPLKAGTSAVACNGVGNGHGESTERNS